MNSPTKSDAETVRGVLFHMILFAMAWVLIGEYSFHFKDYALGAGVILAVVVGLSLYSSKLYDLEDRLPADREANMANAATPKQKGRSRFFALTFVFEGVAIMVTWIVLLNRNEEDWLIPAFAFIAGLHFFPLGRSIRRNAYYLFGTWVCLVAVAGYLLINNGIMSARDADTVIAYGCATGAAVYGIGSALRSRTRLHV
jgi:hypothetical protein